MSKSKNKKKRLSKYNFMYRNQEKGNLPCIVFSFGRFFVASVLSIDTTCLSWYVEFQPWNCVVHLFQCDLHVQAYLLRRIFVKDSANSQTPAMEAWLLKEFRDLRALFEKEVVSKVKEPLVWQRKYLFWTLNLVDIRF